MDGLVLLIILLVGYLVVAPLIALVRTGRLKKSAATQDEVGKLTQRIYALEERLRELETLERPVTAVKPAPPPAPAKPAPAAPPPVEIPPRVPTTAPTVLPAPPPALKPPMTIPSAPPSAKSSAPAVGMKPGPAVEPAETHRLANLEERLGTSWLNKIGTTILVLGIAYFLNYTLQHIGPTGKIVVGYAVGVILIALGVVGERRERYRIAARAVLGGGWAIVYFTTYAMHNVTAVRVIESDALGFTLLFAVAAAMVLHTLRYNSQVATGFAYLLAFASIAVSRIGLQALVASAALGVSLMILLWRRKWYALEPPAVLATYLVHWMWLHQVFETMGRRQPFLQIPASAALLTLYWAVWMVSYFLREENEESQRALLTASFFLNLGGYLVVMRYQAFYPWLRFWFLLAVGAVYLGLSPLGKRLRRRTAFVLTTTIGAALIATAVPYRFSGARLELLWLAEAEAFLVAGWRLVEVHLRRLGWAAAAALTIYLCAFPISDRLVNWRGPDAHLGWQLAAIGVAFFLNARLAPRLLGADTSRLDETAAEVCHFIATALVLAAVWVAAPLMWVAMIWAVVAVGLGEWGRRTKSELLRACGHGAALLALVRLCAINLPRDAEFHGISLRLVTVAISAALFFLEARRLREFLPKTAALGPAAGLAARFGGLPAAYSSSATLLAALIIWKEATNMAVGLAWGMLGLALLEAGRSLADRPLRAQGHFMLTLSLVRIFIADLNGTSMLGPVSARVVTVSLLAAIYYYVAFSTPREPATADAAYDARLRSMFLWYAAIPLVALMRFELETSWVAVGWAILVVIFYRLGSVLPSAAMRYQAYLLTVLVGVRCALDNFYQLGSWRFTSVRTATVVMSSVLVYLLFLRVLWDRRGTPAVKTPEATRG